MKDKQIFKFKMEIPIEISFESDKPKRRGPPARFAAMMKQKENPEPEKVAEIPNPVKEMIVAKGKIRIYILRS